MNSQTLSGISRAFNARKHILLLALALPVLGGCDFDYWWSRGQPPAPSKVLDRSITRLNDELTRTPRSELQPLATQIKEELLRAANALKGESSLSPKADAPSFVDALEKTSAQFQALEGKLSWGSRPPYGELSGQLRALTEDARKGVNIDAPAFEIFAAHTAFFLANELTVPAPVTQ